MNVQPQPQPQPKNANNTWNRVHKELRRRITERVWAPGELMPSETDLAIEFGCARATVNRAMRELADSGLVDRRRKVGTRVIKTPVRKATLDIPIIRIEIEQRGAKWHHATLERKRGKPTAAVASRLSIDRASDMLHLRSLHFADRQPYLYEDRWINIDAVPDIVDIDLDATSANEWLVQHAPFTSGDFNLSAANASASEAKLLGADPGAAILIIDRTTFNGEQPITSVRLAYAPGYRMQTTI